MSVHKDTLQGLKEALAYVNGDTTQARKITLSDDEIEDIDVEMDQLIFQKIIRLSSSNKQRTLGYIDGLLQASGGVNA